MTRSLSGKVALVTGAAKGIGAGIAKAMTAAGASVVVNFATDRVRLRCPRHRGGFD
jgi:3-oxoacyl-[acyl-carrier protein] reductase